jgi:hypothetical protein
MENNPGDQKVIDLLSKLKNDESAYPSELLELRRRKYMQKAVQVGFAIGGGAGLKNILKGGAARVTPTAGTWLEAALVIAIVLEVSTAAYVYRNKLADLLKTGLPTPGVQEVAPPPVVTSLLPATEISVVPTVTGTETRTATPTLSDIIDNNSNSISNGNNESSNYSSGGNNQAASTPAPNGNNGNHFGQTKQPPQSTKEPKDTKVPKNK